MNEPIDWDDDRSVADGLARAALRVSSVCEQQRRELIALGIENDRLRTAASQLYNERAEERAELARMEQELAEARETIRDLLATIERAAEATHGA